MPTRRCAWDGRRRSELWHRLKSVTTEDEAISRDFASPHSDYSLLEHVPQKWTPVLRKGHAKINS
jgi:hypothetical protein